jgi:hypothetical protein
MEIYDPNELMKDSEHCTLFEDVAKKLAKERNKLLYDPYWLERAKDYNALATQVVGSEIL